MNRSAVVLLGGAIAFVCVSVTGRAQDALKVAPEQYSLLFENDEVRVLTHPGDKSPEHEHPPRVAVRLRGRNVEPGSVVWTDAQKHAPTNNSQEVYEAVIVELKRAKGDRPEK